MKLDPKSLLNQVGEVQRALAERHDAIRAEASSGGGMVRAVCDGQGRLLALKIDPEAVAERDTELLEDLVRAAVGEAQSRARQQAQEETRRTLGNLPIPGGIPFKL